MRSFLRKLGLAVYGGDELFLATVACGALGWALYVTVAPAAAFVALAPWLVVVQFFRDPSRKGPDDPDALLAPADGTVRDIEVVEETSFMKGRALRIGIFLSPLNVHVNRTPCAGTVRHLQFRSGAFLPAYNPDAPTRNESQDLGLVTGDGSRVLVKQISGVLARRIVCEAEIDQTMARGERYGMIKLGSRTELYVPADAGYAVEVSVGQAVRGGRTVLVRCPRPEDVESVAERRLAEIVSEGTDEQ